MKTKAKWFRWLELLAMLLLMGGCSSTYRSLPRESSAAELMQMQISAAAWPEQTTRVPVRLANGGELRVAVHESGPADAARTLVFIHGVLSDARVWRFVRGDLAHDYHLIIIDLPGSGKSDAPPPRTLREGYSPDMLCRAVLDALRSRIPCNSPSQRLTLVGHSLGGMLAVRMLSDEKLLADYADVLKRVDGSVLFTPIDVAVEKELPAFREIVTVSDTTIALAKASGVLREKVAKSIRTSVVDPAYATREEADRVIAILGDAALRHAHQSMLTHAVPWTQRRPNWPEIEKRVQCYSNIQPRCLIVWGARDEMFPLSMGYKLAMEIPHAQLRVVPASMHCLPVEHPATCAALVREFLQQAAASPDHVVKFDAPPCVIAADSPQRRD